MEDDQFDKLEIFVTTPNAPNSSKSIWPKRKTFMKIISKPTHYCGQAFSTKDVEIFEAIV